MATITVHKEVGSGERLDLAGRLAKLVSPVSELDEGLLVSATYDGDARVAVLKFYDPKQDRILLWCDNTGHLPYCYTRLPEESLKSIRTRKDVIAVENVQKLDLLSDSTIDVRKIVTTDPLAIGGSPGRSIRDQIEAWEADIKYYENYVYDRNLRIGTYYRINSGNIVPITKEVPARVRTSLEQILAHSSGHSSKFISEWAELLGQPLCSFRRIATDIEVANEEGRVPDPEKAERPVIAISFYNDQESLVLVASRSESANSSESSQTSGFDIVMLPDERAMLRAAFAKMVDYPIIITFNGDDFDLRYLKNRALALGIPDEEIPIALQRQEASLKHGLHIDLYRFFNNRSIQIYVYGKKYSDHTLNGVAEPLLGKTKIEFEGNVGDLPTIKLAEYCLNDAQLTYELTSANSSLMMKILLVISRIAKMPMNDVARLGVSNWIRSLLFYEHRRMNALIPRQDELKDKGGAASQAIIKGKKYKGGLVIEPKPGVHFGVSVLDFASLYPSIIKVFNLSYETVNCPHEECRSNTIPDVDHWVCTKRSGIESLVTGSLRDLRVTHYKNLAKDKSLSKEDRDLNSVVSQGLKVILNASYGVMGFETFALYCLPVADATAALGRYAITRTIEKCREEGISVVYSDTDSLFIENPEKEKIEKVVGWAEKELGVELDVDKVYRYVAFSERKKNYFGVLEDGTADIKGLTGKKSQTPEFLKRTFYETLEILGNVKSQADFEHAKHRLRSLLTDTMERLRNKKIPMEDLAFNVMMGKSIEGYGLSRGGTALQQAPRNQSSLATDDIGGSARIGSSPTGLPQHVKAAELLRNTGKDVKAGEIISFVKTKTPPGVKPASMARPEEIDVEKYTDYARSMFDQILDSLDVTFDEIIGRPSLDAFWS